MAKYPIKLMLDHNRKPFIPYVSVNGITIEDTDLTLADMLSYLNNRAYPITAINTTGDNLMDQENKEKLESAMEKMQAFLSLGVILIVDKQVYRLKEIQNTSALANTYIFKSDEATVTDPALLNVANSYLIVTGYYSDKQFTVTEARKETSAINLNPNTYATKKELNDAIAAIPEPDLSIYETKEAHDLDMENIANMIGDLNSILETLTTPTLPTKEQMQIVDMVDGNYNGTYPQEEVKATNDMVDFYAKDVKVNE